MKWSKYKSDYIAYDPFAARVLRCVSCFFFSFFLSVCNCVCVMYICLVFFSLFISSLRVHKGSLC